MGLYLIAAITFGGTLGLLWVILKVLLGLGFVIFVHELGHFLVAKACGVKCEKFYLGFDVPLKLGPIALPRTLAKFQWGETEYGVGVIPLGGYVKMLGQDDNPVNAQQEAERIRVTKNGSPASSAVGETALDTETSPDAYELDPRSYPAKSVPQRMAIISAGVIMNLIFAVIFAAIAYRMGVTYLPCEIGGTSAGSPAWIDNFPIGAKIVQIGRTGRESQHLRFDWDLRQQIALSGLGGTPKPLDLQLQHPDGKAEWVEVLPSDRLVRREMSDFATIGVRPADTTTLSGKIPVIPHMAAGAAHPPLAPGDRIVGAEGRDFDPARANEQGELPSDEAEATLAQNLTKPITFLVERAKEVQDPTSGWERFEVTVPPNPLRRVGLQLEIGPVEAVRKESPAAKAGVQVGDVFKRIAGQPIGDPLVLPQRLETWVGQEVDVEVERNEGLERSTVQLQITLEPRYRFDQALLPGSLIAIESMGVAYAVKNTVVDVESGSPAQQAGLRPGDVLRSAKFVTTTPQAEEAAKGLFGRAFERAIEFDERQENWPYVSELLQLVPEGTDLQLGFVRSGQEMTATVRPVTSAQWFYVDRGLQFASLVRVHTADSWSEAWGLGGRETKEKLQQVLSFLGKLLTFQVSPKTLGGPLMIAAAAGSEASQGIPRLLLFLTLLSANLAILNFLPIPALDGGHMVFLAAEAVTGKPVDERLQGTLT
ncbi:MAG: site-2 protease family protein, partial [Pirellulaceae bacterium]